MLYWICKLFSHFTGILHDLESSIRGCNGERKQSIDLEDEAESAYSSALSLAQTFEGAKNVLVTSHKAE